MSDLAAPAGKTHLIVSGTARSGTTALAELLNAHEGICLGIERFKFQYLRRNNYDAGMFAKDRFFDFRAEDTNLTPEAKPAWAPVYEEMARKWDGAAVIGDKVPVMAPVLGDFLRVNPDFRCIYILRNLKDVALSWQARADRVRDSWPAGKGFEAACESWDAQMRAIHALTEQKAVRPRILILNYDTMYLDGGRSRDAILAFLELGPSAGYEATFARHAEFYAARSGQRVPRKFMPAFAAVDKLCAFEMRKRARSQVVRLTGGPAGAPGAGAKASPKAGGPKAGSPQAGSPKAGRKPGGPKAGPAAARRAGGGPDGGADAA